MGKKDKSPELSKKERKALALRQAELLAELEKRERKAEKKKAGKKGKGKKNKPAPVETIDAEALGVMTIEAEAPIAEPVAVAEIEVELKEFDSRNEYMYELTRLHEVIGDETGNPEDLALARALLAKYRARGQAIIDGREKGPEFARIETDEAIAARVKAKREARAAETRESEKARLIAHQKDVEENGQPGRVRKAIAEAKRAREAAQTVEAVETETGREFVAGEAPIAEATPDADFAKPSESLDTRPDFETNGLNQYKIKRLTDGKMVGYTRATTYIANLEDTSALTKWKLRVLLEGVATAEASVATTGSGYSATAIVRNLAHVRDVAIEKARRADRKGKLAHGDLAALTARAWSDFKKAMDTLADELFEVGGGREKATKGTDIHKLTEIHDEHGIDRVGEMLTEGEISPADMADVEAYAAAIKKLGATIVEQERVIVNDDLKVAGRLDRVVMVKLPAIHDPKTGEVIRPAEARARRRVLDIKTGRIDYGQGKLAQQIGMYAGAKGYNLETHEREDLKLDQTVGLVLHLPAGSGEAHVHIVDLVLGRRGNKLSGEVRTWRNEGKKAVDLNIDVLAEIDKAAE